MTVEHILLHETKYGKLPKGSIVICNTDWASKYLEGAKQYLGFDQKTDGAYDHTNTILNFPGITSNAAELFVER